MTEEQFEHIKIGDKFKLSDKIYSQFKYEYIGPNLWTVVYKDIQNPQAQSFVVFTLKNDKGLSQSIDCWNKEYWDVIVEPIMDLI